ncbi:MULTISPECIES: hypothetical protein [Mesorhizobium]|uniref:hypothetical protein n=1 Tax=Mesorhizobium TaxID=68287 RepID=UPI000BDB3204|nr:MULTISPECIES: hypothetical protein [Mesorhizobium]PBC07264.1 hypothetical protein CK230_26570 [Mesorhizobium sp. WSM3859]
MEQIRLLGLDIHKEQTSIAVVESGRGRSVGYIGEICQRPLMPLTSYAIVWAFRQAAGVLL